MEVKNIMTEQPMCCTPNTNLQEVAQMMVDCDCGAIPVVENHQTMRLVGIVTDRDITSRTVAQGKNPLQMSARDVMSTHVVTVTPETSIEECCSVMEENMIRRVPVVDKQEACCGIVAQADIARNTSDSLTGEVVEKVSEPIQGASKVR